jgi:predicted nucleic acid-binding protein
MENKNEKKQLRDLEKLTEKLQKLREEDWETRNHNTVILTVFNHGDKCIVVQVSRNAQHILWNCIIPNLPKNFSVRVKNEVNDDDDKENTFIIEKTTTQEEQDLREKAEYQKSNFYDLEDIFNEQYQKLEKQDKDLKDKEMELAKRAKALDLLKQHLDTILIK